MEIGLAETKSDSDYMTETCKARTFESSPLSFPHGCLLCIKYTPHTPSCKFMNQTFLPVQYICLVGYIQLEGSLVFVFCTHNNPPRYKCTGIDELS